MDLLEKFVKYIQTREGSNMFHKFLGYPHSGLTHAEVSEILKIAGDHILQKFLEKYPEPTGKVRKLKMPEFPPLNSTILDNGTMLFCFTQKSKADEYWSKELINRPDLEKIHEGMFTERKIEEVCSLYTFKGGVNVIAAKCGVNSKVFTYFVIMRRMEK